MPSRPVVLDLGLLVPSWALSVLWSALAIVVIAVSQALGASAAGCDWIGICVPIHRQPWALVNQPGIAFASTAEAHPYWLASSVVPLVIALVLAPLAPRARSVTAELNVLLASWWLAVVALAWVPMLDPSDGHLVRWLTLHDRSPLLVWIVPAASGVVAALPALHLLGLVHRSVPTLRRRHRLAIVGAHLWLPTAAWVCVASMAAGTVPSRAAAAVIIPLVVATAVAWLGYPRRRPDRLDPASFGGVVTVLVAALVAWSVLAIAGRPLAGGRVAGVQWSVADRHNNVRSWIEPWRIVSSRPPGAALRGP